MLKNTLTYILFAASSTLFAQNVEFKSSNFKDKKDEFKKIEATLEKGDAFYKTASDAVFQVQNPGKNFKKALIEFETAQKFNPNNAELNMKIGVCWAYSSDPQKAIPYIKKAKELNPACSPFLNYYIGYSQQLEGNFDEALKSYIQFETEYKKADDFSKFVAQRKKECASGKTSFGKIQSCSINLCPNVSIENVLFIGSSLIIVGDCSDKSVCKVNKFELIFFLLLGKLFR